MCCCDKPNINGEFGYKWQPDHAPSIRPVDPPTLSEYDTLLYDEPGRCGGTDSHCRHYRVVVSPGGSLELLVQHGGGKEFIYLANSPALKPILAALDTHARYWLLNSIAHAYSRGMDEGVQSTGALWRKAAAEKRIRTRKLPKSNQVKVWIEPVALIQ